MGGEANGIEGDDGSERFVEHASNVQRVNELRRDMDELNEEAESKERELTELQNRRSERLKEVMGEVCDWRDRADGAEYELEMILNPPVEEEPPPGPKCLNWVMTEYFNLVATLVIVSNITLMVMEVLHKELKAKYFWVDQSFMVFYVMEIVVKVLYLRCMLVCGKISVVWWNWLDLVIVGTGVLDMWLKPILLSSGIMSGGGNLKMFSFLRMLRLLRIMKIFGMFLKSDLTWTEGETFQLFIMGVIGFNSVLMGFESDIPDFWGWFYVEQTLLVIFSFEVMVRLKRWGFRFFCHPTDIGWNLLDFTIVAGGVIDMWLMPAIDVVKMMLEIPLTGKGNLGQIMMMLRMARLLRILRLVRLIKSIPPLYTLVVGIIKAMQGMMWVMVLTVLLLYTFALLCVKLVGHGLVFGGEAPPIVEAVFPTVTQSFFVLFKAMNGDWGSIEPLFYIMPISQLFFVLYMVMSSWAILSILMAVVSENLLQATRDRAEEVEEEERIFTERRSEVKLKDLFQRADMNGNGQLTKKEFEQIVHNPNASFELKDASGLEDKDLREVFEYLSEIPEGGTKEDAAIQYKTFIKALRDERNSVSERQVMRIEKTLRKLEVVAHSVVEMRKARQDHRKAMEQCRQEARSEMEEVTEPEFYWDYGANGHHDTNGFR